MNPIDLPRIMGARLALAREQRRARARERRAKRAEEDAIYAAIDRAVDEERSFVRRCREVRDFDLADLLAQEQETVIVEPAFIRYFPTTLPLPRIWVRTGFDEGFATQHQLDEALPYTIGGAA